MARDIHLSASALHHPSFARFKKHERFNVLLLMSICDDDGCLIWKSDEIAWLLKMSTERWDAFSARLTAKDLLILREGRLYLNDLLFAVDFASGIHIAAAALFHPSFARLKKSQRFNVVLLMSSCDAEGRLTWSPDALAWLIKSSIERWCIFEALLLEKQVLLAGSPFNTIADFIYADCGDEDYDDEEDEQQPTPETYGQQRRRKPSDAPWAATKRKRLQRKREREAAEAAAAAKVVDPDGKEGSQGGVTSLDVTPPSNESVTPPSHTRAFDRIDSSKSNSSNSNDSNRSNDAEASAATVPPKVLPADLVQMLIEKSADREGAGKMKRDRAETLVETHKPQRCLEILLMLDKLPSPPRAPGGWINSKFNDPELEVPAKITAEAKRLLSPSSPKRPPQPAPPPPPSPEQLQAAQEREELDVFFAMLSDGEVEEINALAEQAIWQGHRGKTNQAAQAMRELERDKILRARLEARRSANADA